MHKRPLENRALEENAETRRPLKALRSSCHRFPRALGTHELSPEVVLRGQELSLAFPQGAPFFSVGNYEE